MEDKVLAQRVREVVARAMAEDLDRPGAYPELPREVQLLWYKDIRRAAATSPVQRHPVRRKV